MDIRKVETVDGIIIYLEGDFTFASRNEFQEVAFLYPNEAITKIIVDIQKLKFMDSSAIGMLLVMHENAKKRGIHVAVVNVGKNIKPLFEKSALGNLFEAKYEE